MPINTTNTQGNNLDADYADEVLRFNMRELMKASPEGKNQAYFSKLFGITPTGMSLKLSKPGRLSYKEVYIIAHELGTTLAALEDDTLYLQTQELHKQIEGLSENIERLRTNKLAEWRSQDKADYRVRHNGALDNSRRELAGAAPGARFFVEPEDEKKKRTAGGNARPRFFVMYPQRESNSRCQIESLVS